MKNYFFVLYNLEGLDLSRRDLDVISIEISISTPKKYQSRRSRKSWQFQKVSLDDREISVEISRFNLDEVSQDRTF
jgi:hypothetical protein